jgi:hypothetical protein
MANKPKSEFLAKAEGIKAALNAIPKEHIDARRAVNKVLSEHRQTKLGDLKVKINKLSSTKKSAPKKPGK